jgi:hypothetical protein
MATKQPPGQPAPAAPGARMGAIGTAVLESRPQRLRYWGGWGTISKINAKSVRLASRAGRLPFDQITQVTISDGRAVRMVDGARMIDETR